MGHPVEWRVPQSPRCVQSPPASNAIGFRAHGRGLKGLKVYGGRGDRGCGAKRAANHRSAFRWSDVVVVLVWPRCAIRPFQSISLSLSPSRFVRLLFSLSLVHSFSFSLSSSPYRSLTHRGSLSPRLSGRIPNSSNLGRWVLC